MNKLCAGPLSVAAKTDNVVGGKKWTSVTRLHGLSSLAILTYLSAKYLCASKVTKTRLTRTERGEEHEAKLFRTLSYETHLRPRSLHLFSPCTDSTLHIFQLNTCSQLAYS